MVFAMAEAWELPLHSRPSNKKRPVPRRHGGVRPLPEALRISPKALEISLNPNP